MAAGVVCCKQEVKMAGMENDLFKLKGIGPKWTAALEKMGVDSIKELSHRNADSLSQMVTARKGTAGGLSAKRAQAWISQAKRLQK
jgi:predicted flap endonuclease-1-like 5' DNA nuclease